MTDVDLPPNPLSQAALRMIPKVGTVMAQYRVDRYEQQKRRAEMLGEAAAELLDPEELFRRIAADERLADMFESAVAAAVATSAEAKVRLLGRALATGALASDDAAVDESAEILRLATQLEGVDLRAMLAIEASQYRISYPSEYLVKRLGVSEALAEVVFARLQHLGLIRSERDARINDPENKDDDSIEIDEDWWLSKAGVRVLRVLDRNDGS